MFLYRPLSCLGRDYLQERLSGRLEHDTTLNEYDGKTMRGTYPSKSVLPHQTLLLGKEPM